MHIRKKATPQAIEQQNPVENPYQPKSLSANTRMKTRICTTAGQNKTQRAPTKTRMKIRFCSTAGQNTTMHFDHNTNENTGFARTQGKNDDTPFFSSTSKIRFCTTTGRSNAKHFFQITNENTDVHQINLLFLNHFSITQ